jgi:hypothetical protein
MRIFLLKKQVPFKSVFQIICPITEPHCYRQLNPPVATKEQLLLCFYTRLPWNLKPEVSTELFLVSNFRRVLNVVCFLLGNSPASEGKKAGRYEEILYAYLPSKMEQVECSETFAYKIQKPWNYPEESIKHSTEFFFLIL